MKLAKEIVKKSIEESSSLAPVGHVVIEASKLESIIAENLRRKILNALSAEVSIPFYEYGNNEAACRMASAVGEIVELLSEVE